MAISFGCIGAGDEEAYCAIPGSLRPWGETVHHHPGQQGAGILSQISREPTGLEGETGDRHKMAKVYPEDTLGQGGTGSNDETKGPLC